jgi:hypothetical protein
MMNKESAISRAVVVRVRMVIWRVLFAACRQTRWWFKIETALENCKLLCVLL